MKGEAHEEQRTLIPARPWTAGKLVALSAAFWQACTLQAAVKLDLFTRLGDRVLDEESIARELGAAPRGVSMLLTALTAMELLTCSDGKYANTPESKTLLSRDSDRSVVPMISSTTATSWIPGTSWTRRSPLADPSPHGFPWTWRTSWRISPAEWAWWPP